MAQYSYIKAAGDLLVPATRDARDFLRSKKVGSVLYADFKQARNPAFHRKLFSLLNLGLRLLAADRWCHIADRQRAGYRLREAPRILRRR